MAELNAAKRLRRSARIILLNPDNRALMFRFDVADRPPFWVTAGGECEADETFEQAAKRELFEETGLRADPGQQIARITPEFVTVEGEPVQGDERYFFVRTDTSGIDTSQHTELERKLMTQHRWFSMDELSDWHEPLFPENLRDMIERHLRV